MKHTVAMGSLPQYLHDQRNVQLPTHETMRHTFHSVQFPFTALTKKQNDV